MPSMANKKDGKGSNSVDTPFEPLVLCELFSVKPKMTFYFFSCPEGLELRHYRILSNKLPFSKKTIQSKTRFFQKIFHKLSSLNLLVSHKNEVPTNSSFFYSDYPFPSPSPLYHNPNTLKPLNIAVSASNCPKYFPTNEK